MHIKSCARDPNRPSLFQIMKTINKIRSKDPDIYDTKKEWFHEDDDDAPSGTWRSLRKRFFFRVYLIRSMYEVIYRNTPK